MNKIEQVESAGGQLFTECADWGKGGHFVINAEGKRVRVEVAQEPAAVVNAEDPAATNEPEVKKLTAKENKRG